MNNDDVTMKGIVHLVNCFGELERKLREDFSLAPEGLTEDMAERLRLQSGLLIIANFLKKTNLDEDIWMRFSSLAFDLSELDKGRCTPVLTRAEVSGGRLVDRFDVYMVRAIVVEGLECLTRAGMEELDAARYIALNYPIFKRLLVGRKARKKTNDPTRRADYLAWPIMSWRKSFLDGTVKEVDAQRVFTDGHPAFLAALLDRFERVGAEGCKTFADELLTTAAQRSKALIVPSALSEWSDLPAAGLDLH
jgi:hypothetical protein